MNNKTNKNLKDFKDQYCSFANTDEINNYKEELFKKYGEKYNKLLNYLKFCLSSSHMYNNKEGGDMSVIECTFCFLYLYDINKSEDEDYFSINKCCDIFSKIPPEGINSLYKRALYNHDDIIGLLYNRLWNSYPEFRYPIEDGEKYYMLRHYGKELLDKILYYKKPLSDESYKQLFPKLNDAEIEFIKFFLPPSEDIHSYTPDFMDDLYKYKQHAIFSCLYNIKFLLEKKYFISYRSYNINQPIFSIASINENNSPFSINHVDNTYIKYTLKNGANLKPDNLRNMIENGSWPLKLINYKKNLHDIDSDYNYWVDMFMCDISYIFSQQSPKFYNKHLETIKDEAFKSKREDIYLTKKYFNTILNYINLIYNFYVNTYFTIIHRSSFIDYILHEYKLRRALGIDLFIDLFDFLANHPKYTYENYDKPFLDLETLKKYQIFPNVFSRFNYLSQIIEKKLTNSDRDIFLKYYKNKFYIIEKDFISTLYILYKGDLHKIQEILCDYINNKMEWCENNKFNKLFSKSKQEDDNPWWKVYELKEQYEEIKNTPFKRNDFLEKTQNYFSKFISERFRKLSAMQQKLIGEYLCERYQPEWWKFETDELNNLSI